MTQIEVSPGEMWSYAQSLYDSGLFGRGDVFGEASERVAYSDETGAEIYLLSDGGSPCLVAVVDGETLDRETLTEENAEALTEEFYALLDGDESPDGEDEEIPVEDEIEGREHDLYESVFLTLETFLDDAEGVPVSAERDETVAELAPKFVDFIGELLARGWGISVYRPIDLSDDCSKTVIVDYPYEQYIDDDKGV